MDGITATYTWHCAECGRAEAQHWPLTIPDALALRFEAPRPCPPRNWYVVLGRVLCDRHRVEVTVHPIGVHAENRSTAGNG